VSEPSLLRLYTDAGSNSGTVNDRSFCGRCGSNVKNVNRAWSDYATIPTGILEGDKASLRPAYEFFCIRRAGWLGEVEATTRFDTAPNQ
jgi:hypothetical protein